MYLTKKQFSFTIWIFLIALAFAIAEFTFSYYTQVILKESLYANGIPVFFDIKYLIEILVFWLAVFYLTKDAKASFGAMALQLFIGYSYYLRILLFPDMQFFGITGVQSLDFVIRGLPYLLFGFLHFKSKKWWLFILFHFAATGLYLSDLSQTNVFSQYFDNDLQRLLFINAEFEDGSFTEILWVSFFTTNYLLVWKYVLFFCCFNLIKVGFDKKKILLLDIVNQRYDSLNFTVIFWVTRLTLLAMLLSVASRIYRPNDFYSPDILILSILSIIVAVFTVASFHRNMVTSYILSKGLKVGWNYFFLNAFIINFFIWLYLIIKKRVSMGDDHFKENALAKFSAANRNKILKVLVLSVNCLFLAFFLLRFGDEGIKNISPIIVSFAIGVLAITMFYKNIKAVFILYIIYAGALLVFPFVPLPLLSISLLSAMINLLLWIPVFYLDKMNFVSAKPLED